MSSATSAAVIGLTDETIDKLRELRRLNVDSAKGFEESAELVKEHGLKQAFTEIALGRRQQAEDLATQIEWNEGQEEEKGSYLAAMHRAWIKVREACTSENAATILSEAERGEDAIKDAYENTLQDCTGSPIYDLIATQYQNVKTVHERVKRLRDEKQEK